MSSIKDAITNYAKNTLFIDSIGFTIPVIPEQDIINYREFLAKNNHEEMYWLKSRQELRENPLLLMPTAKTVVVMGFNYYDNKAKKDYEISMYANETIDYHIWIYDRVKKLSAFLSDTYNIKSRFFVDSAPIMEKVLAKNTNIGWQGKHTCVVSREFGSWLFLSVMLIDLEIESDFAHKDLCGTCTLCIDACPTQALTPYKIETKKCISYLTIEHKSEISDVLQKLMDVKIFGCDECLRACHFNKWQKYSNHSEVKEKSDLPENLIAFLKLTVEEFNTIFKNNPIKRTGYVHLLRNVLIALFNIDTLTTENLKIVSDYCNYPEQMISNLAIKVVNKFSNS